MSCGSSSSPCYQHRRHASMAARLGRSRTGRALLPSCSCCFMLRTSTPWELLPARELGCGSWSTVYRRFTRWARAGLFDELHLVLLDQLGEAGRIDFSRVSIDSVSLRAVKRGATPAQTRPTAARPAASSTSPPTTAASPSPSS
jgi:transposase